MINFDEELNKFHPALEVGEVETVINNENAVSDLTELMMKVMNAANEEESLN